MIDIVKFFFIYTLVLFAFACGLNQLLWYFTELERRKCYDNIADPSWDPTSESCLRWRRLVFVHRNQQSFIKNYFLRFLNYNPTITLFIIFSDRFSNLFESCQSLFWASFGGIGIESFELAGKPRESSNFYAINLSYCFLFLINHKFVK